MRSVHWMALIFRGVVSVESINIRVPTSESSDDLDYSKEEICSTEEEKATEQNTEELKKSTACAQKKDSGAYTRQELQNNKFWCYMQLYTISTNNLPSPYITSHPIPYIALSTSLFTVYQSALLSANS